MEPSSLACSPPVPDDPHLLKRINQELLQTNEQLQREVESLRQRLDLLLKRLSGPKSEKLSGPGLFDQCSSEETPTTPTTIEPPPIVSSPSSNNATGHGRKKLPRHLPRVRIEHDLSEVQKRCPCCQTLRVKIGEEVSEQLDYRPASVFIVEHHRSKYVCRTCQPLQHQTAPLPPQPIDKGLAGAGLLSHLVTSKYADHLPLHRLEGILSRQGIDLSRSTMSNWMASCAVLLSPLQERMRERLLLSQVVHTDDTVVPVQEESGPTRQGRLWVYIGDRSHLFAYFDYTPTHSRDGPQQILKDYSGYLQADAYRGYDAIYAKGKIHEVACWAHARRKFVDAKASDASRVHTALGFMAQLYAIESQAQGMSDSDRLKLRQSQSVEGLEKFRIWLVEQKRDVLPKSPFAQAVEYTLSNYVALMRYTEAGYLNIDNNLSERTLRLVAIGRKNWLFAGSDAGGKTASVLYSFTATCKHLGIDPFVYLRDLLTHLPSLSNPSSEELDFWLPDAWRVRQRQEMETTN